MEKREKENKDREILNQKKGEVDAEAHAFIRCSYSWVKNISLFQFRFFGSVSLFVHWSIGQSIMLKCEKSHISGERKEAGKEGLTPFVTLP